MSSYPELAAETMPFGKYRGKRFDQIETKYFWWLLDQPWMDQWPELTKNIDAFLKASAYRMQPLNKIPPIRFPGTRKRRL